MIPKSFTFCDKPPSVESQFTCVDFEVHRAKPSDGWDMQQLVLTAQPCHYVCILVNTAARQISEISRLTTIARVGFRSSCADNMAELYDVSIGSACQVPCSSAWRTHSTRNIPKKHPFRVISALSIKNPSFSDVHCRLS
jgi:hypothetical protein